MTLDEADAIIAELNICFPAKHLVVEEVKRWEGNLSAYHFDDARKAVKNIEDNCKFWPTWAEFREAILPIHKNRVWSEAQRIENEKRALEKPQTEQEKAEIARIIASIRENLPRLN